MGLAAQSIRNDIHLAIMNLQIIVLDQFHPSSLAHVQIRLGEDILQALVVDEESHSQDDNDTMSAKHGQRQPTQDHGWDSALHDTRVVRKK
jgi:hypothetical protein